MSDDRCNDGDCSTGTTCFKHKLASIQFSPACTPTRRNNIPPKQSSNNGWERGIATDSRNMPLLDKNLSPIGLKEYANNRSTFDQARRDLKHTAASPIKEN